MRLLVRLAVAAFAAALPVAVALASCGTDAIGTAACTEIEEARCNLAPQCTPGFDVQQCILWYRDECLVGIENTTNSPDPSTLAPACVTALQQTAACIALAADAGSADGGCPEGGFDSLFAADASCYSADGGTDPITPCSVILECPQVLYDCAFVVAPVVDAGDAGDAETGAGGSGSGGAGGSTTTTSTTATASTASTASASTAASSSTGAGGAGGAGGSDAGDASTD